MKIIPFDNSFMLCEHWLNNAKNNILNKEILNLQISSCGDIEHSFEIVKIFIKNIMNESEEEIWRILLTSSALLAQITTFGINR